MSDAPVTAAPAPAPKLNAIQMIEQDIIKFVQQKEQAVKQYEQAIANVHAIDGAIQATQHLLARLRAEAAKAEVAVKAEADKIATDVKTVVGEVESKVVSIESAVKKEL